MSDGRSGQWVDCPDCRLDAIVPYTCARHSVVKLCEENRQLRAALEAVLSARICVAKYDGEEVTVQDELASSAEFINGRNIGERVREWYQPAAEAYRLALAALGRARTQPHKTVQDR